MRQAGWRIQPRLAGSRRGGSPLRGLRVAFALSPGYARGYTRSLLPVHLFEPDSASEWRGCLPAAYCTMVTCARAASGGRTKPMRRWGWSVCCLVLSGGCMLRAQTPAAVAPASQAPRAQAASRKSAPAVRLLDANDGLAILGAALETRHKSQVRSDCSHLVHSIYEKAGFPYKYQRSSDLYAGDEDFQRVAQPQAGDLIVWPGHAGIVVNPVQHTFYSALRSGFGVQPYDSRYWKGRGRPRFLRYIKARPASVLAARHVTGAKPASMRSSPAVERVEVNDSETTESVSPESTSSLEASRTPLAVPAVLAVEARRPKTDHVKAALAAYFDSQNQNTESLNTDDTRSLAAFDSFEVQKVHLERDHGWAQIRFRGLVALAGRGRAPQKTKDTQRFMLRRADDDRWEMTMPDEPRYLPREAAVWSLAHQLAALTDTGPAALGHADERVQLARWLDELLDRR